MVNRYMHSVNKIWRNWNYFLLVGEQRAKLKIPYYLDFSLICSTSVGKSVEPKRYLVLDMQHPEAVRPVRLQSFFICIMKTSENTACFWSVLPHLCLENYYFVSWFVPTSFSLSCCVAVLVSDVNRVDMFHPVVHIQQKQKSLPYVVCGVLWDSSGWKVWYKY